MNKKVKNLKKPTKRSPVLFDDEDMGTSSRDEVRQTVKSTTPRTTNLQAGHSTPIRNRLKTNAIDSPELNYNESPIEPLTQHPPNEVGWDYARKEDGGTCVSMEISKTPKRSAALLSKKRNSNSPLLHKPLKKKLIQEEQQESMAGFMKELRAIEMKAKQSGEKGVDEQRDENEDPESQLVVEMDSEPSGDSDIKLQVSAGESPGQRKVVATSKSKEELLDDSIEDMLIQCSQQVEAEEFGINKPSIMQPCNNTWRQHNTSQSNSGKRTSLNHMPKENLKPAYGNSNNNNNSNTKVDNISGKNSSSGKGDSNSLEIPDDSFDDFMVEFNDDFDQNTKTEVISNSVNNKHCTNLVTTNSKISTSQNKFFQHKNSTCIKQTKIMTTKSSCNLSETSNASIQNKVMNTNASFGYLNQNYIKNGNSSGFASQSQASNNYDKNNETRLFKLKSYSDSHFCNQNSVSLNSRTYAAVGSMIPQKQENKQYTVIHSESSTSADKSWRRVQSSSSLGESNRQSGSNQLSGNKMSNSEGSLPLSTPAEIERKRQEAIMKREARLKMKLNNVGSQKRPMPNPIKR